MYNHLFGVTVWTFVINVEWCVGIDREGYPPIWIGRTDWRRWMFGLTVYNLAVRFGNRKWK